MSVVLESKLQEAEFALFFPDALVAVKQAVRRFLTRNSLLI